MRKNKFVLLFLLVLMILFLPTICSSKIVNESNDYDVSLTMTVEKKALGWYITTTLVNNGDNWIYVEKDGYGDIGCVIYDDEDNPVWWTYEPDEGEHWQIGPDAVYESFTIWSGTYLDRTKVPKGNYKIVGKAGYFEGNQYVPLETEDYSVQVEKAKTKNVFINNFIFRISQLFQKFNSHFIF
jgi:hypothetical protein